MVPLLQLNEGDFGEIAEIEDCSRRHCGRGRGWRKRFFTQPELYGHNRMADLGLRIGKKIQLLQKAKQGPVLIKVDDARIAVGQKMAEHIFIKDEQPAEV